MSYKGFCIGGSFDGKWIDGNNQLFIPPNYELKYVFHEIPELGWGLWLLDGEEMHDAIEQLVHAYEECKQQDARRRAEDDHYDRYRY